MKVFIYGFVSVYVGLLSKSIFIFLFDKYINHIAGNVDFCSCENINSRSYYTIFCACNFS